MPVPESEHQPGRMNSRGREIDRDEPPATCSQLAIEATLDDTRNAVSFLKTKGIKCRNRIVGGEYPQVFGWMPAVAIYFNDPDGHLLEFISMLPNPPPPDLGLLSWEEWDRRSQ